MSLRRDPSAPRDVLATKALGFEPAFCIPECPLWEAISPRAGECDERMARLAIIAKRTRTKTNRKAKPFEKMGLSYKARSTRPFTHAELARLVEATDAEGDGSIGTAAMIAYYWLQREADILSRLSWTSYRPTENPNIVCDRAG
jgi:hypothetical protein